LGAGTGEPEKRAFDGVHGEVWVGKFRQWQGQFSGSCENPRGNANPTRRITEVNPAVFQLLLNLFGIRGRHLVQPKNKE
jgi:hypothetical protein